MTVWSDDIVGQKEVLAHLDAEVLSRRRAHAYIFTGPRGVGKRLAGIGFALRLLCPDPAPPCTSCPSCRAISVGRHPDLMILQPPQGRRTIPVDFIRDLIAKISLRPALAEGRVFLIDEAHLLSEEGANALLKTLEEPPEGSALILVTDRCEDLLPTILSRSRVVRFRPANFGACCAYLQDKGIGFEEAQVAAAMALGSPGRAEAVLESPLFRGRAEVADAILDLTTERLCTTADRLWALSVSETRMPLEARRRALLDLLDFLIVFAWDGARAGWGGTVRNRDLGTALTRARIVAPQRWEAVALRLFEAKRQVLANVVPALVLDAALADVSGLLKPLD